MSDHAWGLVCPFLLDGPVFARGVEFGLLYARMRDPAADVVEDYLLRANQEQVTLLASRLGWRVAVMEPWDEHWFFCRLERPP